MYSCKKIVEFDETEYGLFLSTEDTIAAVSINKKDGTIIFDNGSLESFLKPMDFVSFNIFSNSRRTNLVLQFLDQKCYIGEIDKYDEAVSWIDKCNQVIYKNKPKTLGV